MKKDSKNLKKEEKILKEKETSKKKMR